MGVRVGLGSVHTVSLFRVLLSLCLSHSLWLYAESSDGLVVCMNDCLYLLKVEDTVPMLLEQDSNPDPLTLHLGHTHTQSVVIP